MLRGRRWGHIVPRGQPLTWGVILLLGAFWLTLEIAPTKHVGPTEHASRPALRGLASPAFVATTTEGDGGGPASTSKTLYYVWPLLGFILVCALLLRSRAPPQPVQAARALEPMSMQQQQVPPGYMLVPQQISIASGCPTPGGMSHRELQMPETPEASAPVTAQQPMASVPKKKKKKQKVPSSKRNKLTPKDFKGLLERSRHDELLAEGLTSIRQMFLGPNRSQDIKEGIMTAKKVLDLSNLLVQELEDSLVSKVGHIANCLHRWRYETRLSKHGRQYEEEYDKQKGEWEKCLAEHEKTAEQKLVEAARKSALHEERRRRAAAQLLDQWAHGDTVALQRTCIRAWADFRSAQMMTYVQKQQVAAAVDGWTRGATRGALHVCFVNWNEHARNEIQRRIGEQELEAAQATWSQFFDQEKEKLQSELDEAKQRRLAVRQQDGYGVQLALAKWERGKQGGLLVVSLQAWARYSRQLARSRRQKQAVHQVVLDAFMGVAKGSVKGCLMAWSTIARHSQTLLREKQRWEKLLSGERARREEMEEQWQTSEFRKKAQAQGIVKLALSTWVMGMDIGTLKQVLEEWHSTASSSSAKRRARETAHASMLRWLEGDQKGTMHTCFLHWRAQSEFSQARLRQEQEMLKKTSAWEALLSDQRAEHEGQQGQRQSDHERRAAKARAVVDMAVAQWELGDNVGLSQQCFRAWREWKEHCTQLSISRQGVHTAVLKAFVGDEKAIARMSLLMWKMSARHYHEQLFGDQRVAEEKQKWETFLDSQRQQQVEEKRNRQSEHDQWLERAHRATELMLGKWLRGDVNGLAVAILQCWQRLATHAVDTKCFKSKVHIALGRFLEGDAQGLAHVVVINWKHWAKVELISKLGETLGNHRDQCDEATSRRKRLVAGGLHFLGKHDKKLDLVNCFQAWSLHRYTSKQEWQAQLTQNKLIKKYAWMMQTLVSKEGSSNMLAACFYELLREARNERMAREQEEAMSRLDEIAATLQSFEDERNNLDDQLQTAYKQIDSVTETLQKELKTKEELATELREGYEKLRKKASQPHVPRREISSSARKRLPALLPHMPSSMLGRPDDEFPSHGPSSASRQSSVSSRNSRMR